jgi:uncharacterized protein YcbX
MLPIADSEPAYGSCEAGKVKIASLHTYPVKGCHRLDHGLATVEPWGLAGDRRWMVVDPEGIGITQRNTPRLTGLRAEVTPPGLVLDAYGMPPLTVAEPADGRKEFVRVFRNKSPVPARIADATDWFSTFLGRPARLVWLGDPTARTIETHALPGDRVSFADGYPLLLANAGSLAALNDWLVADGDEPIPMTRFRPNLVVDGAGADPWVEDDWLGHRLQIGDVAFRAAKSCARCVVTTIDQETGEPGRQPLRMLARHRREGKDLLFGINLIPDVYAGERGIVRVGEAVLRLP